MKGFEAQNISSRPLTKLTSDKTVQMQPVLTSIACKNIQQYHYVPCLIFLPETRSKNSEYYLDNPGHDSLDNHPRLQNKTQAVRGPASSTDVFSASSPCLSA